MERLPDGRYRRLRGRRAADLPAALSLGAYILPPEFVEDAQDAAKFNGYTDTVAPMCYFLDWGFTVDWVWETACRAPCARPAPTPSCPRSIRA